MHNQAVVFHYGVIMKPWEKNYDGLKNDRPNVHPRLYEAFKHWRESAQKACPRHKKQLPNDKRGPGGEDWEYFHFVNNV